jgi:hypothetical protein
MEMDTRIQLIAILATVGLLFTVLELVRRRRLMERYAILWVFSAVVLVVLAVWNNLLEELSRQVGIATPANALFVVALAVVAVLLLHFSLAVSRLAEQSKILAQQLALAQERVSVLERARRADRGDAPAVAKVDAEAGGNGRPADARTAAPTDPAA